MTSKAQVTVVNNLDYVNTQNFCVADDTYNQERKKAAHRMRDRICKYMSGKELVFRIYK